MPAEIVRSSFTGRAGPSELYCQICRAAIFNPCQDNSSEEGKISFERTKTNHDIDKLPRENNSQNYIKHNLHSPNPNPNPKLCFLKITSGNFRPSTQYVKKQSSYIFLLNQGRSEEELIYKQRCGSLCRRQKKPPGISTQATVCFGCQ